MGRQILGGHGRMACRAGGVTMPGHGKASKSGRGRVAVPARIAAAIPNAERRRDCFIAGVDWRTGRGLARSLLSGEWRVLPCAAVVDCCRCGHAWRPRIAITGGCATLPAKCPKCFSPYWNAPRKYALRAGDAARRDTGERGSNPEAINRRKALLAREWDAAARGEVDRLDAHGQAEIELAY